MPERNPFDYRNDFNFDWDWNSGEMPTLWDLLGERPPTGQTYGPAGQAASDVMMPGEYFDSQYNTGSGRDWPQPDRMDWGEEKGPDYLIGDKGTRDEYLYPLASRYKEHGAVPENVKQSYLNDMLDYYGNTNIQHALVPQEYTDYDELSWETPIAGGDPFIRGHENALKTRYVEAPDQQFYGHTGPDYITMMNIMKGQSDPNFDVGFMSEDYMKRNPTAGAYYSGRDQAIAFNPYKMLDFSDPNVDRAFSQGAGKPRTLEDLEGTSLQIGEDTDPWNLNVVSHELGHAYTQYPWNRGKYKFDMPNVTQNINMTRYIPDRKVMDVPGHNEAYWIGRAHDDRTRHRDMNLTGGAATNIREWTDEARNYIDRANLPRSVANAPTPYSFGTPNFAPSDITPSRTRNPHFNTGGIVSLVI